MANGELVAKMKSWYQQLMRCEEVSGSGPVAQSTAAATALSVAAEIEFALRSIPFSELIDQQKSADVLKEKAVCVCRGLFDWEEVVIIFTCPVHGEVKVDSR